MMEESFSAEYFSQYRKKIGFSNQSYTKNFFGAKNLIPNIDFDYLRMLNVRLGEVLEKINNVLDEEIKIDNLDYFKKEYIDNTFEILKNNGILPVLNNQGRRPEQVYFSWMRGYLMSNFFLKALGVIFEVDVSDIELIGDDDLRNIETFRRTPKADLEIKLKNRDRLRVEFQCGFMGVNDIKQHKVLEARKVWEDFKIHTVVVHFDLYNGQVAFVRLDEIENDSINWITRQQMEGQTVFNIDQNCFKWKIVEKPIKYAAINFD